MAAAGAVGALLLQGGTAEAGLGPGDDLNALHLGETNDATALPATRIESRAPQAGIEGAFTVVSDDPESDESAADAAIFGSSTNATAAGSSTGYGVIGSSGATKAGVVGYSRLAGFPATPDGTGVHGHGGGRGVLGTSTDGDGVRGESESASSSGVYGTSTDGVGVTGRSESRHGGIFVSTTAPGIGTGSGTSYGIIAKA